ncbi:MAG: GYD domain-containing protein [Gammaproteobacteria bacterium]|jgi:uncharacterized protein with GYD domain|nr:GYD domain-containing protein [Gammaproteobacteria bacterium]
MGMFMVRATYTSQSFKGMMDKPGDREAVAKAIFAASGAKVLNWWHTVNNGGFMLIAEGTSAQISAVNMAAMSTGFAENTEVLELLDTTQQQAAMIEAAKIASSFQAPGK